MAAINKFEDIEAWQRARELTKIIYQVTASEAFSRDYALRDQIRRAAISVMSNIAEGFERDGNKEFRQFLFLAKGSIGEERTQLYVANDVGYLDDPQFEGMISTAIEISRMISGFIHYLDRSNDKGIKYR